MNIKKVMKKFENWCSLLNSDDEFDRIEALENPPLKAINEIPCIIKCLKDKSYLVRQAAAEAACLYDDLRIRNALRKCIENEKNSLVREYAISSLGCVATFNDLKYIIGLLGKEKKNEVIVHMYTALAIAVRKIAVGELISLMKSDDVTIKSSVLNAMAFIDIKDNKNDIVNALKSEIKKKSNQNIRREFQGVLIKFTGEQRDGKGDVHKIMIREK